MKKVIKKAFNTSLYKKAQSRAFFTLYGTVIKELRVTFKQFFAWSTPLTSLINILKIYFSILTRPLLGRNLKYSFAFTGEDRILESIYTPLITYSGFYVDVGCNHPKFLSNTYSFYRKGWRGVCIDANPSLIKKFKKLRPKDTAVCALVSNSTDSRDFYLAQNNVLSTTVKTNLNGEDMKDIALSKISMQPESLTSILDRVNTPAQIDILSVDAEEHDLEVIQSLDFSKYSPSLIVCEDELFDINQPFDNELVNYLKDKDYTLIGYVLKNLYFKKGDN